MMSEKLKMLLEQYRALERLAINKQINRDMKNIAFEILTEVANSDLTKEELDVLDSIYIDLKMLIYLIKNQTNKDENDTKPKPKGFK
jgi:hypothetical protein